MPGGDRFFKPVFLADYAPKVVSLAMSIYLIEMCRSTCFFERIRVLFLIQNEGGGENEKTSFAARGELGHRVRTGKNAYFRCWVGRGRWGCNGNGVRTENNKWIGYLRVGLKYLLPLCTAVSNKKTIITYNTVRIYHTTSCDRGSGPREFEIIMLKTKNNNKETTQTWQQLWVGIVFGFGLVSVWV